MKTTYLYTRVLKNPEHYGISKEIGSDPLKLDSWLKDNLLLENVKLLVKGGMTNTDDDGYDLQPTTSGILMAENYIRLATMSSICKAGTNSTIEDLLWLLSNSEELSSSIIVRREEKKAFLNPLNQSASVQYSIKDPSAPGKRLLRVKYPHQKVFLLFMYALSSKCQQEFKNVNYYLKQEANGVVCKAVQIVQCMIRQFSGCPNMAQALSHSLVLKKILIQKLWPDDPMLLTQVNDIGEIIARRLLSKGICNLRQLLDADQRNLESIAQKHFPWGTKVKEIVSKMCPPRLQIQTKIVQTENGLKAHIRIWMDDKMETQHVSSAGRGCSVIIYDTNKSTLLSYRTVRYAVFFQEGISINLPQSFVPDTKNSIIVKVIDDTVLGHDIQISVSMTPSESLSSHSDDPKILPGRAGRNSPSPVQSKLDSIYSKARTGKCESRPSPVTPDALIKSNNDKVSSSSLKRSRDTFGAGPGADVETFKKKYKNLMNFLQIE